MTASSGLLDEVEARHPGLMRVSRILHRVSDGVLYIAGAGLVVMSVIVFWQVFMRYVLNWNNAWTELTAILLMSWFIFLGAAVGVRENYHLGFDVLLYVLPKGGKKVLRTISDVVVIAFAVGMVWYGVQLMILQWAEKMPGLGISGAMRYLPLAVGGALIVLFSLERLALRWAGVDVDRDVHDEADDSPDATQVKEI